MRRLFVATLLAAFGLQADDKGSVEAAERAWGAATAKGDLAALDQMLADDLSYTHSNGETDTKAVFVGNMKSGVRKYHKVDYENIETRVYGKSAITMCTARIETSSKGAAPNPAHLRFIHFWLNQKGRWQLVAHQSLRLPN
jgi:ketosteroid isomerase-like protein